MGRGQENTAVMDVRTGCCVAQGRGPEPGLGGFWEASLQEVFLELGHQGQGGISQGKRTNPRYKDSHMEP